jgi:hypothetical protein
LDKSDALEEMMNNTAETFIKKEKRKKEQAEPESLDIDSNDGPEAESE